MSLSTYSELQAALARLLIRTDITTNIVDYITLFEAQANRRLRVGRMKARTPVTINAEYVDVPADFMGAVSFDVQTSPPRHLEAYDADDMVRLNIQTYPANNTMGVPYAYCVVGREFRFYPVPQESYTGNLTYWQQIPALSDLNASNWLLANFPDAYLYGAAMQSAPDLRADARLPMWAGIVSQVLSDIEQSDNTESFGARPSARARSLG